MIKGVAVTESSTNKQPHLSKTINQSLFRKSSHESYYTCALTQRIVSRLGAQGATPLSLSKRELATMAAQSETGTDDV